MLEVDIKTQYTLSTASGNCRILSNPYCPTK